MGKFLILTIGFQKPSQEEMQKWMNWFNSFKDKIVEQVGLMNGKEISKEREVVDLPFDLNATTGYLVINATDINEVLELAKGCPAVTSTRVYEIREH